MNAKIQCAAPHCRRLFEPDPRVKNQRYCSHKDCQRARKRQWHKEKLRTDPDYKANQRECRRAWQQQQHPDYYSKYRQAHPAYCRRNTLLQEHRNAGARLIAKMDEFKPAPVKEPVLLCLVPVIAKMDASTSKIFLVSKTYKPISVIANRGLDSFAAPWVLASMDTKGGSP